MRWVLTQHCSWRRLTRHSSGKTSASFLSVRYANSTASPAYPWKKHHRQNSRLSVVAVLVNESQTKMPCTRLLFSMQSGPQRNYVERQYCRQVTFVRTSPCSKEPCYGNAAVEKLPLPSQDSRDIIAAACRALNHVWREGYRYMKAGVMLADFTPSGIAQPGLFDEIQPRKNSEKLTKTLDELNQSGKGKVWFAGRGTAPEWQTKWKCFLRCIPPDGQICQ